MEKKEFTILIEHINNGWLTKKKRKYPFMQKDFGLLKSLTRLFTLPELRAMFDCYMCRSPFWGEKTGYLINGFFNERSILLDDPNFKKLTAKFVAEFGLKDPKQVALELGLK